MWSRKQKLQTAPWVPHPHITHTHRQAHMVHKHLRRVCVQTHMVTWHRHKESKMHTHVDMHTHSHTPLARPRPVYIPRYTDEHAPSHTHSSSHSSKDGECANSIQCPQGRTEIPLGWASGNAEGWLWHLRAHKLLASSLHFRKRWTPLPRRLSSTRCSGKGAG